MRVTMICPPKAIVFDFDFTLGDSSKAIVECVGYALHELGLTIPPAERIMDTVGLSLPAAFHQLTGEDRPDWTTRFVRCFHQHADDVMVAHTVMYECVRPLLHVLRTAGIRTGVVSNKLRCRIESILHNNGLLSYFDTIVGADDIASGNLFGDRLQ